MNQQRFDTAPQVKRRLNSLPDNPEKREAEKAVGLGRFPSWLHRRLPKGKMLGVTSQALRSASLHTVCEESKCPNMMECWSRSTATFLAMGKQCTRACGFCDIEHDSQPDPLQPDEPERIAQSVQVLGLRHVVVTMVARDDLEDGGAEHLSTIIGEVRSRCKGVTIEVLTSDFHGSISAWDRVIEARPEIFNHNIETVRRLSPRVRHTANFDRTLRMLEYVKENSSCLVKSGLMVGLGETQEEVFETLRELQEVGVDIVTMGQYLQASASKLRVKAFVTPSEFKEYEEYGRALGIEMYCGPFVRSSYNAEKILKGFNEGTQIHQRYT